MNLKWEKLGKNQKKILILLLGGLGVSLNRRPAIHFKIIKSVGRYLKDFDEIEWHARQKAIRSLYQSNLVECVQNKDGTESIILSEKGKKRALTYNIEKMFLNKPKRWDKKWRIIIFDIPESKKLLREVIRYHLKQMNFYRLQKSVFVTPYKCEDEIMYLMEYYDALKYIRLIVADSIDNEVEIMEYFNI